MTAEYHCEALAAHHERTNFACRVAELDGYFRRQVAQDIRRRVTSCFVAVAAGGAVAGYYTLASAGIPLSELPANLLRRLPRYPSLPAVRIDALSPYGIRHLDMPASPERLWRVIRAARAK